MKLFHLSIIFYHLFKQYHQGSTMETADTLKLIFNCKEDQELADLFGKKDKSVVSHWRKKGLPAAIERQAYELMRVRGIVSEPPAAYAAKKVDINSSLDDIEMALIRRLRERGPAAVAALLLQLITENGEKKPKE